MSDIDGTFQVESYDKGGDYYKCKDEHGKVVRIDLMVGGNFPAGTDMEYLVGKTVTIECAGPFCYVAQGVKVVEVGNETT